MAILLTRHWGSIVVTWRSVCAQPLLQRVRGRVQVWRATWHYRLEICFTCFQIFKMKWNFTDTHFFLQIAFLSYNLLFLQKNISGFKLCPGDNREVSQGWAWTWTWTWTWKCDVLRHVMKWRENLHFHMTSQLGLSPLIPCLRSQPRSILALRNLLNDRQPKKCDNGNVHQDKAGIAMEGGGSSNGVEFVDQTTSTSWLYSGVNKQTIIVGDLDGTRLIISFCPVLCEHHQDPPI